MAFKITRKEHLIDETIELTDLKNKENITKFQVTLDNEEFSFIKTLMMRSNKGEETTDEEEERISEIVFKNLEVKLTDYEKGQVIDYILGKVVNKLGLDRLHTISYATSTLQNKLKK